MWALQNTYSYSGFNIWYAHSLEALPMYLCTRTINWIDEFRVNIVINNFIKYKPTNEFIKTCVQVSHKIERIFYPPSILCWTFEMFRTGCVRSTAVEIIMKTNPANWSLIIIVEWKLMFRKHSLNAYKFDLSRWNSNCKC